MFYYFGDIFYHTIVTLCNSRGKFNDYSIINALALCTLPLKINIGKGDLQVVHEHSNGLNK